MPTDKVAVTLALADKLDTLVGFWAIDEKPTGSSDPYALRRAALGLIRIILERKSRLALDWFLRDALGAALSRRRSQAPGYDDHLRALWKIDVDAGAKISGSWDEDLVHVYLEDAANTLVFDLEEFLADRLKVQLRDQRKRHDLVDAVFAVGDDDLVRIVARVEALDAFLKTEDGANLLAGYKRAANILAAEEKKGKWSAAEAEGQVDASKLTEPAEKALYDALDKALPAARAAVEKEDFAAAMKALSGLRAPVDAFFVGVLVNAPEEQLRRNRLLLLTRLVEATSAVADFSKIEG